MNNLTLNQDPNHLLKTIRTIVLDLDGTVYLGNQLIPGAVEFVEQAKRSGRRVLFLTNNSSRTRGDYFRKLQGLGLPVFSEEEIVSSLDVAIDYLLNVRHFQSVYLFGNERVREECERRGVPLARSGDIAPEAVLLTYHNECSYHELCELCSFVQAGLPYIATHPDINCPVENGVVPDAGSFIALVRESTGREPDLVLGKPERPIIDYTLRLAKSRPEETALIGDRLYTDLRAAEKHGLCGIFVLSGEGTWEGMERYQVRPRLVFSSLREIIPFLSEE